MMVYRGVVVLVVDGKSRVGRGSWGKESVKQLHSTMSTRIILSMIASLINEPRHSGHSPFNAHFNFVFRICIINTVYQESYQDKLCMRPN